VANTLCLAAVKHLFFYTVAVSIYSIFRAASPLIKKQSDMECVNGCFGGVVMCGWSAHPRGRADFERLYCVQSLEFVGALKHFSFNLIEWVIEVLRDHGPIVIPLVVKA